MAESVAIRCGRDGDHLECGIRAVYRYRAVDGRAHVIRLRLPSLPERRVTVAGRDAGAGSRDPLEVDVDADGTELVVEGKTRMTLPRARAFFAWPALLGRHPLLGEFPEAASASGIGYSPSAGAMWASVARPELTVAGPDGFGSAVHTIRGGSVEPQRTDDSTQHLEFAGDEVHITLDPPPQWLFQGGPFLALGGTLDHGFLARAGWEVGFHPVVLASISMESDFRDEVVVTPLVEAATPGILLMPSFAIGAGMPVRLTPDTHPGLRIQLTATLFVSFVSSFDYYPADDDWRVSLLGQVGL